MTGECSGGKDQRDRGLDVAGEMTGECSGGKDQRDRGLDVENNRLYSRSPELDHLSRLRQHLSAASLQPLTMRQRRAGGTNLVMLHPVKQCVT